MDDLMRQEFLNRYAHFIKEVALPDILSLRGEKGAREAHAIVKKACELYASVNARYADIIKGVEVLCGEENNPPSDVDARAASVTVKVTFADGSWYVLSGRTDDYGGAVKVGRIDIAGSGSADPVENFDGNSGGR